MGRMVTVEEWAEIHGKTPATVRRKIHANAWPDAKQATLDGKLVWMLDEDWLWPRAMTPTKQAKLLCEIRRLMPPVVYTTAEDGTVICMVPCTHHTHVASGVTADEMNDLWRAAADLLSSDLSQPIAGRHIGISFHCICEMLLWYCSMHCRYIQGDDKILSISPV